MAEALILGAVASAAASAAGDDIVSLIQVLIDRIDNVRRLDENRELLEDQLDRMKRMLRGIETQFRDQHREVPDSMRNCLERMQRKVEESEELIRRSQCSWRQKCIDFLCCNPNVYTEIQESKTSFDDFLSGLEKDIAAIHHVQQIVAAAPQEAGVLLQDEPATGLIGVDIKSAETRLQGWLSEATHIRTFAVYGMGGVGKTTLLKKVYNNYCNAGHIFDRVIWVTVAKFTITNIQDQIASAINLDLAKFSDDIRRMKLCASTKNIKFLLVLDDMWSAIDLMRDLGVEFGENKGSKVVFTTRNRELIGEMNAKLCMQIQPLLPEEGWELFSKIAFEDGRVPEEMEDIARRVAKECEGLPLAIQVIASTMRAKTTAVEWMHALKQMQKVDPNFPRNHPRIDRELYQKLKLSYESLPGDDLKNCFLHSAMYPEDTQIEVKYLVQRWIAEGLVNTNGDEEYDYIFETGQSYVKLLQNRGLFSVGWADVAIRVHDVVRDMAVYVGEKEENCVFRAGQSLRDFPHIRSDNCKRISVYGNDIKSLPAKELRCSNLVSLFLGGNQLKKIPEAFFLNLTSLRILDLQGLPIKSLPKSLWQLTKLESLSLHGTQIESIPKEIGNLSNLRFLHLRGCRIKSLPSQIAELKNLKYLSTGSYVTSDEIRELSQKLPDCEIVS